LEESVGILERLRQTAPGDIRRDYLASQVSTYQWLTQAYLRLQDIPRAFRTIELSRAKLLAEQLAGTEETVEIPSVEQVQQAMPDRTAILVYANISGKEKALMAITRDTLYAVEQADRTWVAAMVGRYQTPIRAMLETQRGIIRPTSSEKGKRPAQQKSDFEHIITYYRQLLIDPSSSGTRGIRLVGKQKDSPERNAFGDLSHQLYTFLIQPLAEPLADKQELLIVPDGILGFLPFETLMDEQGHYLVECFTIRYVQSLSVLEQIQQRRYPEYRRSLLAFGGAVYDERSYDREPVRSQQQLAAVTQKIYADLEQDRSLRSAYGVLGFGAWDNLPGTLDEVRDIARTVAGADTVIGEDVAEARVKTLSQQGELARYRVLHFATHGLVVPAVPELSAIVLSQVAGEEESENGSEDGYLRMGEIAALDLQADFVNLSACETGLGKIYGGEGVVGLPQAFLLAGANGLSVSLWPVADRSTAAFMTALYAEVQEEGGSYASAIASVKRRFLRGEFGEQYAAPYYWAPFVYYGQ